MFDPWVGKIPWRRKWQPTPVFLPGKSHGQRTGGIQSMGLQIVRHDWAHRPGDHRFTALSPRWTALTWVLTTFLRSLSGEPWLLHTQPFPATEGTAIFLMPFTTCRDWNGPDAAAQPQRQTWRKQERSLACCCPWGWQCRTELSNTTTVREG